MFAKLAEDEDLSSSVDVEVHDGALLGRVHANGLDLKALVMQLVLCGGGHWKSPNWNGAAAAA